MSYINLKYKPKGNDLIAEFSVEPCNKQVAEAIAGESSIGTWTSLTTLTPQIRRKLAAKVFSIDKKEKTIKIAYSVELFEPGNMPQILSSIAGNIFGMKLIKNLRLEDIIFPKELIKSFKGPEIGIKEIRKLLRVKKRPLVGTIIKPKLGLSSKEHAKVAYEAWTGGLDLVKCDENLTSQKFNLFETNIKETLKMLKKAEKITGEKKIYVPNVTAETKEMIKRAKFVKKSGGNCVMMDIITEGWSGLQTLRNKKLGLIIHAHRAGHGMFTRGKHGMSMLTIAKIARLIGVDQIHIGTANVGKMESGEEETEEINLFLKSKWYHIKPVFSICSGGLHPGSIPKLVKMLGKDIIIQAGGGVHGHPQGTRAGAKAMRQALDATMQNVSLAEYAKKHPELKAALRKWVK